MRGQGASPSVVIERNLLIPLPDGSHLAADLYRSASDGPWPAIVNLSGQMSGSNLARPRA